jgi:O-antigen/teichoic acid export membrane protein
MKEKIASDIQGYMTSTVFVTLFNFARNIITAKLLGPYLTGLCLSLITIPQIISYLGLTEVLTVIVPFQKGKNNYRLANEITSELFNYTVFISMTLFSVVLLYSIIFVSGDIRNFLILATSLAICWELKKFITSIYAAEKEFIKLSWLEFWFSLMTLIISFVLIYFFTGYGFWLGLIIPNLVIIVYCLNDYGLKGVLILKVVNFRIILKILPLGIVILLSSVVYAPFFIIAKLFMLVAIGAKAVGYFVLSIIVISKLSIIPKSIASVLMPHISSMHAEIESDDRIFKLFFKSQLLTLGLTLLVVVPGYFMIEPVVSYLLPKFISGVPAARIMLVAGIPYCLIYNANNVLIALHHKRDYLKIFSIVFICQLIIYSILLYFGMTIDRVATSFCFIFMFYAGIVNYRVIYLRNAQINYPRQDCL